MTQSHPRKPSGPEHFETPQRPGQSGSQEQRRPGPSPVSENATGPHPPYEPEDATQAAAIRHQKPEDRI